MPPAACGTYQDVTAQVLAFGIAGKNINPSGAYTTYDDTYLPGLPAVQLPYQGSGSTCTDASPNALIRLERVRDNPSTGSCHKECGFSVRAFPVPLPPTTGQTRSSIRARAISAT